MPDKVHGFRTRDVARIRRVVRRMENTPRGARGERGPAGVVTDTIPIRNIDTLAAPQYGLAWIYDWDDYYRCWKTRRPMYPGISMVCIMAGARGVRQIGGAWARGPKVRKLLCNDYTSLAIGDRVGPQKALWYGRADECGPFKVMGLVPAGEQPAVPPAANVGLVYVTVTGQRADHIIVRFGGTGMVAQALLTSPGYSVYQTNFGTTVIVDR